MSKSPVCRSQSLILVLVLALVVAPLAAPPRVQAALPPVPRQATQRSYPDGGLTPPGPIDASTATTTFSVSPGDFADNTWVSEVTIDLAFAKVGGGICPGPGGARDWAEEIRFRLFAPDGTMVSLVRFNDYVSSNPDVGQVTVTFDDDAAQPVAGLSIQDGTFRPSLGAMADFNGLDPDDVWTLELSDQWLDDPLCFVGATLHITAIFWPDLAIVKTDGPDPAIAGQDLFYSLTVCNNGLGTAGGVVMTDTLPGAVTYLDDSGGCTLHAGDQLVCPMPDLDPGASHSI